MSQLYDSKGQLTRACMEAHIKSGASVIHNGQIHTTIDTLPSATTLAKASGNADEVERVRAEKQAEIDKLKAEVASLKEPAVPAVDPQKKPLAPAEPAKK